MTRSADHLPGVEVPTFSECVVGYRGWRADHLDRLWPLSDQRRPWEPGINTARCNCAAQDSLRFEWTLYEGRRLLEPAPAHAAPEGACDCGLYSWRWPQRSWRQAPRWRSLPRVIGAVASWGALQVHATGFRAEHACVVTLGRRTDSDDPTVAALERIAHRYRAELVDLDELEQAASRHGTPLPDDVRPAPDGEERGHDAEAHEHSRPFVRAPDATPEEVVLPAPPPGHFSRKLLPPGFGYPGGI